MIPDGERAAETPSRGDARGGSGGGSTARRLLSRRELLAVGAAGLAGAAGCIGSDGGDGDGRGAGERNSTDDAGPDAETGSVDGPDRGPRPYRREAIPYSDQYGTVVDIVADGGADYEGGTSIVPVLEAYAGDDTLLYFPPGEYLMDGVWERPSFQHLGLVGESATIVPEPGEFGYLFVLGYPSTGARGLLFEGIDFDCTADNVAPRPLQVQVADDLVVSNVAVAGVTGTARFDVTDPEGTGVVTGLELPDGGRDPNRVGILVGPENRGHLRFERCRVEGFPGNGLYASPSNGPIEVVGGTYANNGIASVRVSGPAEVRGVTVRCDEAPEGFRNMRGIRLRHGESVLVEDCRIELTEVTSSGGALVLGQLLDAATVRNLEIECSIDDVHAINVKSPRGGSAAGEFTFENVTITGTAAGRSAVRISDRTGCRLDGLDVEQTGPDRDGIHFIRTTDSVLRDSAIDVTGEPLVLRDSEVRRVNNEL